MKKFKKLQLLIVIISFIGVVTSQTPKQDKPAKSNMFKPASTKPFMTYGSATAGFSQTTNWVSLEVGCWGVKKPVMYGTSLDWVSDRTVWLGVKPYYQLFGDPDYGYQTYIYFGPKLKLRSNQFLIETGVSNYAQITKHLYFYASAGIQWYNQQMIPGLNGGFTIAY